MARPKGHTLNPDALFELINPGSPALSYGVDVSVSGHARQELLIAEALWPRHLGETDLAQRRLLALDLPADRVAPALAAGVVELTRHTSAVIDPGRLKSVETLATALVDATPIAIAIIGTAGR